MNKSNETANNVKVQDMFSSAIVADSEWTTGVLSDVQEKYLGNIMFRENISELKQEDRIKRKCDNEEKK